MVLPEPADGATGLLPTSTLESNAPTGNALTGLDGPGPHLIGLGVRPSQFECDEERKTLMNLKEVLRRAVRRHVTIVRRPERRLARFGLDDVD